MSAAEPPVTATQKTTTKISRVNAIKSRFENLSSSSPQTQLENDEKRKKITPLKPNNFQRSATSIELLRKSSAATDSSNSETKWFGIKTQSNCARNSMTPKCFNDTIILPEFRQSDTVQSSAYKNQKKQPKIDNDNSEKSSISKFSRQISDPIKRSSIKRSPAFRVGIEKQILTKQVSQSPPSDEKNHKKLENYLVKKLSTNPKQVKQLEQPGLTDSLKYYLKQPLPTGPAPRKPPRTFITSSSDDEFIQYSPEKIIKDKITFLENNFRVKISKKPSSPPPPPPLQKSKTELTMQKSSTTAKILDCLSCHKNVSSIYEADERKPLIQGEYKTKRFTNSIKPIDHPIYMEPFGHLRTNLAIDDSGLNSIESTSNSFNDETMTEQSICSSCPENHSNNGQQSDLHYLCTPIDDSVEETESTEGNLSLGKSYNEISILVDAAFQQKSLNESEQFFLDPNDINNKEKKVKLTRSLTEKRKDYVQRIAVIPSPQHYGTLHKTFKSPTVMKTFLSSKNQNDKLSNIEKKNEDIVKLTTNDNFLPLNQRINNYNKLINNTVKFEKDSSQGNESGKISGEDTMLENLIQVDNDDVDCHEKLFQVCLLVGFNTSTSNPYLKLQYPLDEILPNNIEKLIFPSANFIRSRQNQEYLIILTDNCGYKIFGFCRCVIPENFDMCLPLCYCLITENKSLGFYQKLLKSIESRHGQSEQQMINLLRKLYDYKLPSPGKYLNLKIPIIINSILRPKTIFASNHRISPKRLSLETNPKWLTSNPLIDMVIKDDKKKSLSGQQKSLIEEYEEKKKIKKRPQHQLGQLKRDQKSQQDFNSFLSRNIITKDNSEFDEILIRRPSDSRLENTELNELLKSLGIDLLIIVFSTLLLERKVILQSKENLSSLTKCVLGLQTILYPFQWHYNIITVLPKDLLEICQSPCPLIVGILEEIPFDIEDGIVIDLDSKKILQCCNDEQTIIPENLFKSLKISLKMIDLIDQGNMLSSVLISEAFLRFFVELFGNYNKNEFQKEEFIHQHDSQNIKFFLEWFVETSMFRNFCQDRYERNNQKKDFYNLFDARLIEKSQNQSKTIQNIEMIVKNSKIINSKKRKTFKERFKDFLHQH